MNKQAVIYCRVSSVKQNTRGDGLNSQETRCREYARYKGYSVEKVFKDDISGGVVERPAMKDMLSHLRRHTKNPRVVVIDDISRLARGLEAHLRLRTLIGNAGASLESPSIEFGDDSDSLLVENMLASVSQHHREKNSEQTVERMRSRLIDKYYVFAVPVGYRYERAKGGLKGKVLVRDEPAASIVQEALEGYASGRFGLKSEVQRFLEKHPEFPHDKQGRVHPQYVHNLLTRIVYAGYLEYQPWGVSRRRGHHEALITLETFNRIQERLAGKAKVPARKNLNEDFVLRGFVTCGHCGSPLTACWSKGSVGKRYAYYYCVKKGCESRSKMIGRDTLEGEFAELLKQLTPSRPMFDLGVAMLRDIWENRETLEAERVEHLKRELAGMGKKMDQLLNRIVDATSQSVVSAYEGKIEELERQKLAVSEKIAFGAQPRMKFEETLRTSMEFLGNPHQLWVSERHENRLAVLRLVFGQKLAYVKNEGFRTYETTLPFKVLGGFSDSDSCLAPPRRFERPT